MYRTCRLDFHLFYIIVLVDYFEEKNVFSPLLIPLWNSVLSNHCCVTKIISKDEFFDRLKKIYWILPSHVTV